jgi:hypothetical protein
MKTVLLFQQYSAFCVFIPINLPKTSLRSLNIMIHNMGQFTQRLSKNRVCCFSPRHNVTSENRRLGSRRISEGRAQIGGEQAPPRGVRPIGVPRPPQIDAAPIAAPLCAPLAHAHRPPIANFFDGSAGRTWESRKSTLQVGI